MRTKLLLSAAILAAGVAASQAQNVYSVNVVGYVNLNVYSNQYVLIENPLDDSKGDIITNVMPLNNNFDQSGNNGPQSTILMLQAGTLNAVETYYSGFGWYPGTNTMPPGRGFYFYSATNATVTLAGTVITNFGVTLNRGYNLVGSAFPASTDLYDLGLTGTNNVVNGNPDTIYRFIPGQGLVDDVSYYQGYGWYEVSNNVPVDGGTGGPTNGPALNVGEAFYYHLDPGNTTFNWQQAFYVQ